MQVIKQSLENLRNQVLVNKIELEHYVQHYPYVQYRTIDLATNFRHKINSIGQKIGSLITSNFIPLNIIERYRRNTGFSDRQINLLAEIKVILEHISCAFLTTNQLKNVRISAIMDNIQRAKELITFQPLIQYRSKQYYRPKNHSFQAKKSLQLIKNNRIEEIKKKYGYCRDQKDKKVQISMQMHKDLREKQQQRPQRTPERFWKRSHSISLHNHEEDRKIKEIIKQRETINNKKKFNYLQDYEKAIKRIKQKEVFEINQQIQEHNSPKRERFNTVNSTEYQSTPSNRWNNLQSDLPELNTNIFDSIKKCIDFGLAVSNIRFKDEQSSQKGDKIDWQDFDKESVQEDPQQINNDLDDSLEMMKEKEKLNKTGAFIEPVLTEQIHEYSFSNDSEVK